MIRREVLFGAVCGFALFAGSALAQTNPTASPAAGQPPPSTTSPTATVPEVVVTAQRLNAARQSIQPSLGASTYTVTNATIQALPGGDNQQLNQVLLQLPSVVQDSFGQFHVRDDHANLQYRLNGIILPEGIAVFGQTLSPRLVQKLDLITGAMPAQYGLRTAGVIDIQTKSGLFDNGGVASIYGGSRGLYEPSLEYGGHVGATNVFVSAEFKRTQLGVESPDGKATPTHDRADEFNGFAYVDHILGESDRVAFITGVSNERFQIPVISGQQPAGGLTVDGQTNFLSDRLNDNQLETTDYAIASLLHDAGPVTAQASVFARYSTLTFRPTAGGVGDLLYTGLSQNAKKVDLAIGGQFEGVYRLNAAHTLRAGFIFQGERATSLTNSSVLPVDATGAQTSDQPFTITDKSGKNQYTYSLYLQDEFKLLQNLTLNYGLRFDDYEGYRSAGQLSPRVNLVYTPTSSTTIHAGYARYFTPPPFELVGAETVTKFSGTSSASTIITDTTPYAERTNYIDVGVQQHLGAAVTVGIDGYYKMSKDLIDEGQFGAPVILTPYNYSYGRTRGVELSMNYAKRSLTAYANLAYERGQGLRIITSQFNFNPDDLAYIANHYIFVDHNQTITASAGVSYLWRGTRFSGDALYGSGLRAGGDVPNGGVIPAYVQANLSVSRAFAIPHAGKLEARIDILNIADEDYKIRDGTGVGVGAPQFGARRAFEFGLSKSF